MTMLYVFMALLSASVVIKLARPLRHPGSGGAPTRRQDRAVTMVVIVVLPLLALLSYHQLGAPTLKGAPVIGQDYRDSAGRTAAMLATRPAQRLLSQDSRDIGALVTLGQLNVRLGKYDDAVPYLRRALVLSAENEDFRTRSLAVFLGETLMMQAGGTVTDEAKEVFDYVLRMHPKSPLGLYYTGVWRAQQGDRAGAIAQWRGLLGEGTPTMYWKERVRKAIAVAQEEMRLEEQGGQ